MVKITIDLPDDINEKVAIYSIKRKLGDKRKAIVEMLRSIKDVK